ncbi:MAG: hypothetical protein WCO56_23465 [Verrucomicrobiota bacterium]
MKKTPIQWFEEIQMTREPYGVNACYVAVCPVCGATQTAEIANTESTVEMVARSKVLMHIRTAHPEVIDEAMPGL